MTWQLTFFYCAFPIVPMAFLFHALEALGIFRWVYRRLNEPTAPPIVQAAIPYDDSAIKADIDKLKLALSVKEFKR